MEVIDYQHLKSFAAQAPYQEWIDTVIERATQRVADLNHGDLPRWLNALEQLPLIPAEQVTLDSDAITAKAGIDAATRDTIEQQLLTLRPWRKGPYHLHGVFIDTEWRSNLKWARLSKAITPLKDRHVLDIGCGNGYYLWRMLGEGARSAIGIDPGLLLSIQFQAVRHFVGTQHNTAMLPLGVEHLPPAGVFDTVFSMGVIYHRRDPREHLQQILSQLRPGGEMVLETLIIESETKEILQPEERYAQMRNVWMIPSLKMLEQWVKVSGFTDIKTIDVALTTTQEQRSTEWMPFHSLENFLDPLNRNNTIEGYPAPLRAVVTAQKPG